MKTVIVQPWDVWDVFFKNLPELRSHLKRIAENTEYGVVIYVTEEDNLPDIQVYVDDDLLYSEACVSRDDCAKTVRKIYEDYLTSSVVDKLIESYKQDEEPQEEMTDDDYEEYAHDELEGEIEEREDEIDLAISDLLETVCDSDIRTFCDNAEEIMEDCKEHFLEYLYLKWGFEIRRPMFLEDEHGVEFYEEFPYDCIEFEDADDPIYKLTEA